MAFDQKEFNSFTIENGIVGIFEQEVRLKSGRTSNWYVNWRNAVEDVFLADMLTDHVVSFIEDIGITPRSIYGVPEGATKLGVLTQYKWAKKQPDYAKGAYPLPMGRGKPKEYGMHKDKFFVGAPRGSTLIVEDVSTTGGAALETVHALREAGIEIIGAISLTNRMEKTPVPGVDKKEVVDKFSKIYSNATGKEYTKPISVEKAFGDANVSYWHMSNALDLLPPLVRKADSRTRESILTEFRNVGVQELIL